MDGKNNEARRRGIRVAAQVAAIGGLMAASAGLVHAEAARPSEAGLEVAEGSAGSADGIAEAMRVRASSKSCGCAPCWGPPAPPPMPAELAARLAEAA